MASKDNLYPAIVIGLGMAGAGAAVYLSRMGVQPIAFEKGLVGGKLNESPKVEDYPGFKGSGLELSQRLKGQLAENEIEVHDEEVVSLDRDLDSNLFTIVTTKGEYKAYAVVIASGIEYGNPTISGMEDVDSSFVSHKPLADALSIKGKGIVVWTDNDNGLYAAEYLAGFAKSLVLVVKDVSLVSKGLLDRISGLGNVQLVPGIVSKVENVGAGQMVTINGGTKGQESFEASKLFAFVGGMFQKPNTAFVKIREVVDDQGNIAVDNFSRTFVKGLFAAGDVQQKDLRRLSTAAADGAMAGIMAYDYVTDLRDSGKMKI